MAFRRFKPDVFALGAFALPLAAYVLTLSPSAFWLDSGIYLAAARELGIAYPPGFPLYVLLAHAFGAVPAGTFAARVHLLSALSAAGACLIVYVMVLRTAGDRARRSDRAIALAAAAGFGASFALWSQAVNSEVYALQTLITGFILLRLDDTEERPAADPVPVAAAAGAGFACHPMIMGIVPALGLAAWRHRSRLSLKHAAVFLLAGLLPYAYIPFRSRANPLTDWGNPETAANFLRLVTASHWTAEKTSFSLLGAGFWERAADAARLFYLQFHPLALAAGVAGALALRRTRPATFRSMLLAGAFAILIPLIYTKTKEFESWFLPAYLVFAVAAGVGARLLRDRLAAAVPRAGGALAVAAFVLLYPCLVALTSFPAVDRSRDWDAEDYGRNILRGAGRNAILLIGGDNPSSSILFCQAVAGVRPDVKTVNQDALRSAWYRDYVRDNLGLRLPEPAGGVPEGDSDEAAAAVETLIDSNPSRPCYALLPRRLALRPDLRFSPSGMVFRVSPRPERAPAERWEMDFHDPESLTAKRAPDQRRKIDEARAEMRAGYLRAFLTGGREMFGRGAFPVAARLFARAADLSPDAEDARLWHGIAHVRAGDYADAGEAFRELVRAMPDSFRGHYNLGNVLAELGDRAGARESYLRALRINPDFSIARDALRAL